MCHKILYVYPYNIPVHVHVCGLNLLMSLLSILTSSSVLNMASSIPSSVQRSWARSKVMLDRPTKQYRLSVSRTGAKVWEKEKWAEKVALQDEPGRQFYFSVKCRCRNTSFETLLFIKKRVKWQPTNKIQSTMCTHRATMHGQFELLLHNLFLSYSVSVYKPCWEASPIFQRRN